MIASHIDRAQWLYPTPNPHPSSHNGLASGGSNLDNHTGDAASIKEDENKYRPFLKVEAQLQSNVKTLMAATSSESLSSSGSTQIAGALTSALTHINKQTILSFPTADTSPDTLPTSIQATGGATDASSQPDLVSRILILSVSADLTTQYIPIMNAIFAAQRRHIPIDVLKLAGDTGFLQQACDATGGVYMDLSSSTLQDGSAMLQYLMMAYLPDSTARRWLVMPGGEEVDFRAACFCHQRVVDLGYVCSVCLSIFCEPMADGVCLTCGTLLELPMGYNVTPAVVPRRKKKKKKPGSGIGTPMDVGTPTPG